MQNRYLPVFLIVLGVLLLSYYGVHQYFYWKTIQVSATAVQTSLPTVPTRPALPTHITIPWYVESDIEPMAIVDGEWGISPDKTSFLADSARPGEAGNIILYGHNKRKILGNIRALKGGETITITTADSVQHQYTIDKMKETDATDLTWLQPTQTEVLTMYTCSGLFDSKRFLVRAVPKKE